MTNKTMTAEELASLWEIYRKYCTVASYTHTLSNVSVPDFLGWLQQKVNEGWIEIEVV